MLGVLREHVVILTHDTFQTREQSALLEGYYSFFPAKQPRTNEVHDAAPCLHQSLLLALLCPS